MARTFTIRQLGRMSGGLAGSGKVIAVIGGLPCMSVSRMLEKQPGPPRLRGRDGEDRFGLPMLTEAQQQKTDGDTAMFLKQLGLHMHVKEVGTPKHGHTWSMSKIGLGFLGIPTRPENLSS